MIDFGLGGGLKQDIVMLGLVFGGRLLSLGNEKIEYPPSYIHFFWSVQLAGLEEVSKLCSHGVGQVWDHTVPAS